MDNNINNTVAVTKIRGPKTIQNTETPKKLCISREILRWGIILVADIIMVLCTAKANFANLIGDNQTAGIFMILAILILVVTSLTVPFIPEKYK